MMLSMMIILNYSIALLIVYKGEVFMEPIILTDSCSDLPRKYIDDNHIPFLSLTCHFKGGDYEDDFGKTLGYKGFYDAVRSGAVATTSQINTYHFIEEFKKYVLQGKPVIYLGFSSALSGCVGSAENARRTICEEYPNADITVIDTKCASLGQGLMVYYAVDMAKRGCSKEEIVNWVEGNKLRLNHWFTVEDLVYLKRGGRISSSTAILGTLLDIKPVMHVDDEGRLVPVTKVKGRKKSLKALAQRLKEGIVDPENQVIAISHGDCLDDAVYLRDLILEDVNVKDVIINNVGPVIGSHSGPGTVALFFLGQSR